MACMSSSCGSPKNRGAFSEGRPQNTQAEQSQEERGRTTSARTVVLPLTRLRESVLTHSTLTHIAGEQDEIRPLEARARSAGMYYGAIDVDDSLGPHGGPGPEEEVTPASAEEETEKEHRSQPAAEDPRENTNVEPKILRVP